MRSGWTRREFLAATNAAALLLVLESCSPGSLGKSQANTTPLPGGNPREQALNALRLAIRKSPDHLASRAADAVATRDAAKIAEFVRDRIGVLPGFYDGADPATNRRWGSAATLRAGQGTLRERADVLADLLTRAGFKAQVMQANLPATIKITDLYASKTQSFAPDQALVDIAKSLLHQAGYDGAEAPHAFDPGPDAAAAILAALPASLQNARVRADLTPLRVPVVAIDDAGKQRYAFALGATAIVDSAPAGLTPSPGSDAAPIVTFTVSAMSNAAPGSSTPHGALVDLVTGRWPLDVLAGHQVLLTFPPMQGAKALLDSGLESFPVRLPILRVQTDAAAVTGGPALIAAGDPITVQGDVLGAQKTGSTLDGPFGAITFLADADRHAAEARVSSIKVSPNASAFPEIELTVDVSDSTGASVDGLDARSFTVREQGAPVPSISVYSNARKQLRPRVLVVYDSYPDWWPSAAAKAKFDQALAAALVAQAATTPIDVQVIPLGGNPSPAGWAAPDAAQLATAFGKQFESADDPWGTVGGPALDEGVSAFIVVSDFNNADGVATKQPTYQRRLVSSKVPVYAVPTGKTAGGFDAAVAAGIVSASGGASFDENDPATPGKIAAAIGAVASGWVSSAYRLRYTAPAGGPSHRSVAVGIAGRDQPRGAGAYDVPAQPVPPPSFVGLYLRIDVQGGATSFRRLAGAVFAESGGPQGVVDDPAIVVDTRAALDGVTTIAVEPGAPTQAAMLDDLVTAALSVEPLWPVIASGGNDRLLTAGSGIHRVPIALASMVRPESVDPSAPMGTRFAVVQERVVAGNAQVHLDLGVGADQILPLTTDRHAAFKATLSTSLGTSLAEAATFADSAYGRLKGQALTAIASGDVTAAAAFLRSVPAAKAGAWQAMLRMYDGYHVLAPTAGAADAFWIVDQGTGEAKAVMLDGTGGAVFTKKCSYDNFDQLGIALAMLSIACAGPIGASFFCVGVNVAATGMAVASLFNEHWDPGTPVSIALAMYNPWESMAGASAGIGIMLLLITLQSGCK